MIPFDGPIFSISGVRFTAFGPPQAKFRFLPNSFGFSGPVANGTPMDLAVSPQGTVIMGEFAISSIPEIGETNPPATATIGYLVLGTSGNDVFTMSQPGGAYGFGGNDRIDGSAGPDFISGGSGVNVLRGGSGNDRIVGGDDRDDIHGDADNDELNGLGGRDSIYAGDGNDIAYGGDGNDLIEGGTGGDLLLGENGNDEMYGGPDDDVIDGGEGNDELSGQSGKDRIHGGAGNDMIRGDKASGKASDGPDGDDELHGDGGSDAILGGGGNDRIFGGDDFDWLGGGPGDDTIDGGAFFDEITGGEGNDTLIGGPGGDIFRFLATASENGIDHILDYSSIEGDRLDLTGPLQFISFLVQRDARPGSGTAFDAFTENPSRPFLLNHQLVKLVDIAGGQDISTAGGLREALADGGEYSSFNLNNASQRAVIYTASSATATTFQAFYVTGTTSAIGALTVEMVGVIDFAAGSNFSTLV